MAVQGKCDNCKTRYMFSRNISPVEAVDCPTCHNHLEKTSSLSKYKVIDLEIPYVNKRKTM